MLGYYRNQQNVLGSYTIHKVQSESAILRGDTSILKQNRKKVCNGSTIELGFGPSPPSAEDRTEESIILILTRNGHRIKIYQ